ncbi:flagellin N-terminal helical domain-containing protein [Scatolibacter rhodanostii]|uniref:flagellin N-terminal helical domain-containing protein n=1 Tax=Scatolibacter rhodanostii TaxID=2014781 RepID=UPI000C078F0D|nr:flagellin [Scatolibacter rhodanostii]
MRVSDRSTARNYLKYLNQAQAAYAKTNEQIASKNRFTSLSEDVSSGTRVLRARTDLYKAEKQLSNVKSVNDELSMAEETMTTIQELMVNISTLSVSAMSEEKGDAARKSIANEIKSLKDQILSLSNTKFGQRYLFGGSNSGMSVPFETNSDGKLLYNGIAVDSISKDDNGYFYMDSNNVRQTIPANEDVYLDIGLGMRMKGSQVDDDTGFLVSYSGLDIMGFGTDAETGLPNNIYNLLNELENNVRTNNQDALGNCNTQLTALTDKFRSHLTDIGSKTNFLDTMQTRLQNSADNLETRIFGLMGTDYKEASTALTMNDYVLKAVLQMGSRILPTSLMDFLN